MCDISKIERYTVYSRTHIIEYDQIDYHVEIEGKEEPRAIHLMSAIQSHFDIPRDSLRVFCGGYRIDGCVNETLCELGVPNGARLHVHRAK